jgi:hypothetical protein
MDHKHQYEKLIENARARLIVPAIYQEIHHIKPRCMGGSDHPLNLVALTAREHFIAHKLLAHIHRGTKFEKKLLNAVILMSGNKFCTNRIFGYERERLAILRRRRLEKIAKSREGINARKAARYKKRLEGMYEHTFKPAKLNDEDYRVPEREEGDRMEGGILISKRIRDWWKGECARWD